MSDNATIGQQVETQRNSRKPDKDVSSVIPIGRRDEEFGEPGAFGQKVAEKMLAIAKEYFPPASTGKQD